MNNNTPSHREFKLVVSKFDAVIKLANPDKHVHMGSIQTANKPKHVCGTPMCHGGWYAAASGMFDKWWKLHKHVSYQDGAAQMAVDLGFDNEDRLIYWAVNNSELWGNRNARAMFSGDKAFKEDEDADHSIRIIDIRNWWAAVNNRIHDKKIEIV